MQGLQVPQFTDRRHRLFQECQLEVGRAGVWPQGSDPGILALLLFSTAQPTDQDNGGVLSVLGAE